MLYIFNPERDLELGMDSKPFTPSAGIAKMRKKLSLIPAVYATQGSYILIDADMKAKLQELPDYDIALRKGLLPVTLSELHGLGISRVIPWGWSHQLRGRLASAGINESILPATEEIERTRQLSHRRITMDFHRLMHESGYSQVSAPIEFTDAGSATEWGFANPGAYFKAPWSSSGHGVFLSDPRDPRLGPRISRIVASQGSIMGEIGEKRAADFATEWFVRKGKADFLGYSYFTTRSNGAYAGNEILTQQEIVRLLRDAGAELNNGLIAAQESALEKLFGRDYEGPVGIDMLLTADRRINPCVEINIRFTMGHVALARAAIFPEAIFSEI